MIVENPKTLGNEHLDDTFPNADVDDMGRRVITAGNQKFFVRSAHRSGLWQIYTDGGPVPVVLQGWFTNIRACEDALKSYAAKKDYEGIAARKYHQDLLDKGFEPAPPREEKVKKKKE